MMRAAMKDANDKQFATKEKPIHDTWGDKGDHCSQGLGDIECVETKSAVATAIGVTEVSCNGLTCFLCWSQAT